MKRVVIVMLLIAVVYVPFVWLCHARPADEWYAFLAGHVAAIADAIILAGIILFARGAP